MSPQDETFIEDITDGDLADALSTGRYLPTDDPVALDGFDVAVVCVPTPLRDGAPDLSYVEDAADIIATHVTPGCCVILESTSYPGTTEEIFIPILETGSGLRAGSQFSVGYSPERIDPGNAFWHFHNTPKVIAGVDQASLQALGGLKRNSRDTRQSPAIAVAKKLADLGADLRAIDPLVSAGEIPGYIRMVVCESGQIADVDLVIVLADHDAIDWELFELHADRIFDTRNRLRSPSAARL